MKLDRLVVTVLLIIVLGGCRGTPTPDPNSIETWELMPFYGEIRFLIVRADTGVPIPGVTLDVSGLPIAERRGGASIQSDQEGRIAIHQLARGNTYRGAGPPPPTFNFSAPQYQTRVYSVKELAAGTSYDPYRSRDLPTTTFLDRGQEVEIPVWEFTVRLDPSD
jgi:hypothetical protein